MCNRSTVLVTGGTGLVGQAVKWVIQNEASLSRFGLKDGEEWIFLSSADGDLRDINAATKIFEKYNPTLILHLAAKVGGLYANSASPVDFLRDNLAIDQNVLKLAHNFKVEKMVSTLSTCIFPDKTTYPIDESMLHDGPPHPSNFAYAYAKRMLDVGNRAYNIQNGCKFTAAIPTNIYGPHDNFGPGSHFVPAMIRKFVEAKELNSPTVQIMGSGSSVRQFIYSRDLAKLMIWTLREYSSPEPIILSVGEEDEISIKDTVHLISNLIQFPGEISWDTTQSDGQIKKTANNSKLKNLIGDFMFTTLDEGLAKTLEWYIANPQEHRI